MSTTITDGVFRNKKRDPFLDTPSHGTPGWRDNGPDLEEVILWVKADEFNWMSSADFKAKKSEEKARHIAYYKKNPEALIRKIRSKCRGPGLLRRSRIYDSTW